MPNKVNIQQYVLGQDVQSYSVELVKFSKWHFVLVDSSCETNGLARGKAMQQSVPLWRTSSNGTLEFPVTKPCGDSQLQAEIFQQTKTCVFYHRVV